MSGHAPFLSAIAVGWLGLTWPVSAVAGTDLVPRADNVLMAQLEARLADKDLPASKRPPGLTLGNGLRAEDRFDLANRKVRSKTLGIGPVELALTAGRAANFAQRYDMPYAVDRWTLKFVGASASLSLLSGVDFVLDAEYARMARRLSVLEVTPHRLATGMARLGGGFSFGENARLMLDYISVARSRHQDDLTRMAEALGGAPVTGRGPELSFALGSGTESGQGNWRFSLASLQRPMNDLGLAADGDIRTDARAMLSFTLHL